MKVQSVVLAMAMALGTMWGACSTGGGSTDTGNGGAGGSSNTSGGEGGSCSNVTACGGSVVGTWTVTSSCLKVMGQLDPMSFGAMCPPIAISGSLKVSGTWTANADGTVSDDTITTGQEQFSLDKTCLVISSFPTTCEGIDSQITTLGYDSVTCTDAPGGGCKCSATVNQKGGLGVVSGSASKAGNHMTANNVLAISGDSGDTKYSYCASGEKLSVTPQSTSPALAGTIVFQKGGTSGMGGGGGQGGSGGETGVGGAAGSGNTGGAAGSGGAGGSVNTTGMAPCDIYKSGGTPCVAAHSTVRALLSSYSGKLYQVRNSAMATKDINAAAAGGVADGAAQDAFCMGTTCVITLIYDQTGNGLDLWYQGSGSPVMGVMQPASATKESIKVASQKVYSLWMQGSSYWVDGSKKGMPLGQEPEGVYMVTSGGHFTGGCCFDYGNSETTRHVAPGGAMDALNFSSITLWQTGADKGPWIMADFEGGLFLNGSGMKSNPNVPVMTQPFITAVLKNDGVKEWSLKGGDATSGGLTTIFKGNLPGGHAPMQKQGAIVLGSGGDCCLTNTNLAAGTFYEGAIVKGYPSDATEDAVQANIVAARYSN